MSTHLEFEQVYAIFQPKVHRYLTRLIGEKDAEDLTQEVLIKVEQALADFNHKSKLSTWIYQIATNVAIDRSRSRSYKQAAVETNELIEINPDNIRCGPKLKSIEDQIIRKEMNECIRSFIETLPEQFRIILTLREIEGLKVNDISKILGLSTGGTRVRLHRARERLKKILLENCSFYRTECCGRLVCEPIPSFPKKLHRSHKVH